MLLLVLSLSIAIFPYVNADNTASEFQCYCSNTDNQTNSNTEGLGWGECDCRDGVTELRLKYVGTGIVSIELTKGANIVCDYINVKPQQEITCNIQNTTNPKGPWDSFDGETPFVITHNDSTLCEGKFHTSCSQDIVGTFGEDCDELFCTGWRDKKDPTQNCDDGYDPCPCNQTSAPTTPGPTTPQPTTPRPTTPRPTTPRPTTPRPTTPQPTTPQPTTGEPTTGEPTTGEPTTGEPTTTTTSECESYGENVEACEFEVDCCVDSTSGLCNFGPAKSYSMYCEMSTTSTTSTTKAATTTDDDYIYLSLPSNALQNYNHNVLLFILVIILSISL